MIVQHNRLFPENLKSNMNVISQDMGKFLIARTLQLFDLAITGLL